MNYNYTNSEKTFDLQKFAEDTNLETVENADQKESQEGKTLTQAELDGLIKDRLAREKRKWESAQKQENEKKEADRLKSMSEAERQREQQEKILQELAELKEEKKQSAMMDAARTEFRTRGYSFSDALVRSVVSKDADNTKDAIDSFIEEFNKAVQAEVKKRVPTTTPKTNGKIPKITKEDIFKVQNATERQRLIRENIELFK